MRSRIAFALLFVAVLATRLLHSSVIWIEESYPAAGAIQILAGKVPYRDFWYDKPPLTPYLYTLWGAWHGWPLRVVGALYLLLCAWLAWKLTRSWIAPVLTAFFLTFYIPSAVMAMAPDLLMLAPHFAAAYFAIEKRPVAAGLTTGVAMLINTKAVFLAAVALVFLPASGWAVFAMCFAVPQAAMLAALWMAGAVEAYWLQVWQFGFLYSRDTFVVNPLREGIVRTLAWMGFHAALVVPAAFGLYQRRELRPALWTMISLAGVFAGLRFFPRYYFQLLPPLIFLAAAAIPILKPWLRVSVVALCLIPLVRFGPRFFSLDHFSDLALNRDSKVVASKMDIHAGDTLLVWGYRPDLFLYTRMPAGSPYLDSQPLTGVIADRHLTSAQPTLDGAPYRRVLVGSSPTYIVDALGQMNPALAIYRYGDLQGWLANYREYGRTEFSVIYKRK